MAELQELVAEALLGSDYAPADSARIRAVPDTRTIRYYTTLGILKPPAQMQGRTALYNESHLLQLVAIKRLQAQEMSLADIQARLAGQPNSRLTSLARLPDDFWIKADKLLEKRRRHKGQGISGSRQASNSVHEAPPQRAADEPYWLTPAALPDGCPKPPRAVGAAAGSAQPLEVQAAIELLLAQGVRLNVTLTSGVDHSAALDLLAIRAAAKPLLKELMRQKIIRP